MDQSDAEDLMDASRQNLAFGLKRETVPPQTEVSLDLFPLRQQFRSPRSYAGGVLSLVHRVGAGTAATFQIVYRSKAGTACARLRRSPPLLVSSAWRRDAGHSLEERFDSFDLLR